MKRLVADGMIRFKNLRLAEKMFAVFVPILGLCLLFCLGALQVSFRIYDGKLYEKSLQELDFFTQQVNDSLDDIERTSYYIALDTKLQENLSQLKETKPFTAAYSAIIYQLRMMLNDGMMNNRAITGITYTDGTTTVSAGLAPDSMAEEPVRRALEEFHALRGAYALDTPGKAYPYLLSGRDILKHTDASLDYLGSLLITSDVAGIIGRHVNRLEAESAALCVYTEDGTVLYEDAENMRGRLPALTGEKGYQIIRRDGQRYFLCYLKSAPQGWIYVNMFPYSEIYGQNLALRAMLVAGFLLFFVISALLIKRVSHMIVKPLEQLTQTMQIVETGDFKGARQHLGQQLRTDEIGLLAQEFQLSLDKIDHLIHENYEKQLLLKDTKYRMLQAQINPHFLYNTLNSITWMIRAQKNKEAADMTVALGDILRAALSSKQYVTLEEELYNLKKYIRIQEYRYQKRVEFQLQEDARILDCLLPHMTLQPLVENAICHCVEKLLRPCAICVTAAGQEGHVVLTVADDGPGMAPEELERVRRFEARSGGHGIGMKNIWERLRMAFEDQAELRIESGLDKGTTITIVIPEWRGGEENRYVPGNAGRR